MLSPAFRAVFLVLSLPMVASSCICGNPVNAKLALSLENVFRGIVTKKLTSTKPAGFKSANYIVRVTKVFKGCSFVASERIVVTTGDSPFHCGIDLQVNGTYAFSGDRLAIQDNVKAQLGKNTKILRGVFANACSYNVKWSAVTVVDLKLFRNHDNSQCVATCDSGADCPNNHFCDDGKCVAFDRFCFVFPPPHCPVSPCSVAPPCMQSSCEGLLCTVSAVKCHDNFCDCSHEYIDTTNMRVCKE
jgi:hypothetical protein